jgi:hypothetical protein
LNLWLCDSQTLASLGITISSVYTQTNISKLRKPNGPKKKKKNICVTCVLVLRERERESYEKPRQL